MKKSFFIFIMSPRWLVVMMAALLASAHGAESASPALLLSTPSLDQGKLAQGEPLLVSLRVHVPYGSKEAFALESTSGFWTDAISVEIVDAANSHPPVKATVIGQADSGKITVSVKQVTGGLWRIAPQDTQSLPVGNYVVRASATFLGKGSVPATSRPLSLSVVAAAGSPSPSQLLNRAHDALANGNLEAAAKSLDALIEKDPEAREPLLLRAMVAERAGNAIAARVVLSYLTRGFDISLGPPPADMVALERRIEQLEASEKESANPPAWSWPPARILAIPEILSVNADSGKTNSAPSNASAPKPLVIATSTPNPASSATPVAAPKAPEFTAPAITSPSAPVETGSGKLLGSADITDAIANAEAKGQWAKSARASSQYSPDRFSPEKATGAPNVALFGNDPESWCPATQTGIDWLELTFAKPVRATEVRVRQNNVPGTIVRVEAIEPDGKVHVWWAGRDPLDHNGPRDFVWFAVQVPRTDYRVEKIKLTLDQSIRQGWKEIDAVQLVGEP